MHDRSDLLEQLFYKNDTAGGQSGSPLFTTVSSRLLLRHRHPRLWLPHGSSPHSTNNHGTRVNSTVAAFFSLMRNGGLRLTKLNRWRAADRSPAIGTFPRG